MPRWVWLVLAVLAALALVPFACVASARGSLSARPRIQLIRDMGSQPRFTSQQRNPLFADGRAARLPVAGTVARERLGENEAIESGKADGKWVATVPVPVTTSLIRRGQERFGVYCAPCHGLAGYGDGVVAKRAERLQEGTWVPPTSLHADAVRGRTDGEIYDAIRNGIRTMPAYGAQIPVADRWAIVSYVRALERSQNARIEDVPVDVRTQLPQ